MVVLLYIPLMANGIEHFFGYLFVICISSSLVAQTVKCLPTMQETQVQPLVGKIWRRKWQPTPGFLPGKSYGRRNLVGYSPWDCKEAGKTEPLHYIFFSEMFVFFCPWSNWLLLSFESSFYILDTSTLLDVWLANIFSPSVACVFMLLTGSFGE